MASNTMVGDGLLPFFIDNALNLWRSTLVGNPTPEQAALSRVLNNPQPGDLVYENSRHKDRHDPDRLGQLLRMEMEPRYLIGEEHNSDGPLTDYWYILDIDGNEGRWTNCVFIRVLTEPIDPIKEANERGLLNREVDLYGKVRPLKWR